MGIVKVKRVYEPAEKTDGIRILVDRLWPRGLSKEHAKLDYWLKHLGPSTSLRKWFNHEEDKFTDFKHKYIHELQSGEQQKAYRELETIITKAASQNVTLLFAARNERCNHVQVLKELIDKS